MADPDTELQFLKGVGPARSAVLARLGLRTVRDLLFHVPREWQDRREITPVSALRAETSATVRGTVLRTRIQQLSGRNRRRVIVVSAVSDGTGVVTVEFWQQRFRAEQLAAGRAVLLHGRVTWDDGPKMVQPEVETHAADDPDARLHADRIVPVHPGKKGIFPAALRLLVHRALECADRVADPLPPGLAAARDLPPIAEALREIHFPSSFESLERARRRMKYEELFLLEIVLARRRLRRALEEKPHRIAVGARLDERIRARFPFRLTSAQERVIAEIRADLASPRPMHRLLQGDVGSGKTAVAVYAMLAAVASKLQAALLAPTEILAEQHFATLSRWLAGSQVRTALLTGGRGSKRRREALAAAASGEATLVIGTHALLEEEVRFAKLGLVVVDEQHRFGVVQRASLRRKGLHPDVLVMSATPIPRTLTMTLFGDLDLSVLDEKPPGRAEVTTVLCGEGDREQAYDWVRREIARGRRVYHIVPLVEENEELPLKSAVEFAGELRRGVFPGTGVGLLHGRMSAADKDAAMEAFRSGATPVLVATSVVEVGVDVPEATVLLVEHAERFGLAQLHQLRGRIGRGSEPGRVILFHDARTPAARARLEALAATTDGFRIAEEDLRIRGPGEFLGTRQSGIPELRSADLVTDIRLLEIARQDAFELVRRDPGLEREGATAARALDERFGPALRLLEA